jgi:lysophospholipase L1-like esterase
MSPTRRVAANLAVFAVALSFAFALGEVVLRLAVDLPLARRLPEVRYNTHPIRRFSLEPNQQAYTYGAPATILSNGLRSNGVDTGPRAESAPVIIALGDSFTFGLGVNDDQTWPARLESALRKNLNEEVRVLNAGTISYGVFQQLDQLKELVRAERPVIVIHALYWNDFMNAAPPRPDEGSALTADGYFVWDGLGSEGLRSRLAELSNRSALLYTLKSVVRTVVRGEANATSAYGRQYTAFVKEGLGSQDQAVLRDFYANLNALAEQENFAVFSMVLPVIDIVGEPGPENHAYPLAVRELLGNLGIPFVDGFELWGQRAMGRDQFLPQGADAHLDASGYSAVADAIAASLVNQPRLARRLVEPGGSSGN